MSDKETELQVSYADYIAACGEYTNIEKTGRSEKEIKVRINIGKTSHRLPKLSTEMKNNSSEKSFFYTT